MFDFLLHQFLFQVPVFMDELAVSAGVNPLDFRLHHLTKDRLRAVLELAAEKFGWRRAWRARYS